MSLNALFDKLEEVARERGFKRLFTTTGISAVAERLEELGYEKGDENVTQYVKELG